MPHDRADDHAAIRRVLTRSYEAWAAGDAAAMVAEYTPDATAIMTGSLRDGREAIRNSMAAAFAGPLKKTRTYNKELGIRLLGEDAAIVVSEAAILFGGQTEAPEASKVSCTWVMEKRQGEWLIAAYHNCPASAAKP